MRISQFAITTLREDPHEAEIASHRLMLRAGLIRQAAAGIYTWLPIGLRVLHKVEAIVHEEMQRAGAQEVLMPGVQPAELWQESGRWDEYGPELLRIEDRSQRAFCLGPTHEEMITDLVRKEIRSYKQLPAIFYQIQTKFRDEIRPRFGIMRAREFLMKDAYSFHLSEESLQETYTLMFDTYRLIFKRLGLDFRPVRADSGNIGGDCSHEFHVLADTGEDQIVFSETSDYAANIELAEVAKHTTPCPPASEDMRIVDTPGQHSIAEVSNFLGVANKRCLKTLLLKGIEGKLIAIILRGDHALNVIKAERLPNIAVPLEFADEEEIRELLGCSPGSIGPVDIGIPVFVDNSAAQVADFVCGANEDGKHLQGVNWGRDLPEPETIDLRNVVAGEMLADNAGKACLARGIEVGHIFKLGTKYSTAMKATCLDKNGQAQTLVMGCYGIGVSRILPAAIEQNHDSYGIIWPEPIAPFQLILVPVNMHRSQRLFKAVINLYDELQKAGIEVLLDDRKERLGVMLADSELLGIPHRFVFSERGLDKGSLEYTKRVVKSEKSDNKGEAKTVLLTEAVNFMQSQVGITE